jgi:hypothetical protein
MFFKVILILRFLLIHVIFYRYIVRTNRKSAAAGMENVTEPARKQQPPPPTDLDKLKTIFLEDMEHKDKVYGGYNYTYE